MVNIIVSADIFVSVDPGTPECAVAFFERLILTGVFVEHECDGITGEDRAWAGVCELPQVDGRGVPAQGLIKLAAAGALCAGRLSAGPVQFVTPSEWKGQQKKPIHHHRAWSALSEGEQELLGGVQTHNAIALAQGRGAADGWRKPSQAYYRARELAIVDGLRIDHNILDAVALGLWALGRIDRTGKPRRST